MVSLNGVSGLSRCKQLSCVYNSNIAVWKMSSVKKEPISLHLEDLFCGAKGGKMWCTIIGVPGSIWY